jgi:hypothetical protein
MPQEKGKGTGEPGWTEQEKSRGAPQRGDAGAAGEPEPKAGYGGDARARTEAAAAETQADAKGKPEAGRNPKAG